jgi:hypothetical protein
MLCTTSLSEVSMRSKHLWILAALLSLAVLPGIARADLIDCTIADYQDTTSVLWDTLATTDTLRVVGTVTGADTYGSGYGIYIEDFTLVAQYRGVLVFSGENIYSTNGLSRGDLVRVTGRYMEYNGGSELVSLQGTSFGTPPIIEKLSSGVLPAPLTVTTGDIAERSIVGELYEGMYCRLSKPVIITNNINLPFNCAQAVYADGSAPYDTILIDTATLCNPTITKPNIGVVITFLQGIFDQKAVFSESQYRGYRLQCRDGADITFPAPPGVVNIYAVANDSIRVVFDRALDPVTSQDVFKYARMGTGKIIDSATLQPEPSTGVKQIVVLKTTSQPQVPAEPESVVVTGVKDALGAVMTSAQGDGFLAGVIPIATVQTPVAGKEFNGPAGTDTCQFVGKTLTVRGTVTGRLAGSLVWIEDPAGGLRSGIKLYAPSGPMALGEDVTVVGIPIEYYDETEFSGAFFERINGAGVAPPPIAIAANNIDALNDTTAAGGTNEVYEHVLVQVQNVGVEDDDVGFGEFMLKAGGPCFIDPTCADTVHVDDRGRAFYVYRPTRGDQFASVAGVTEISYGYLKIEPRIDADFVRGPVVSAEPAGFAFALRNIGANPVSFARGAAQFAITLPQKGTPTLALYDLRGRRVATLTDGTELAAGPHTLKWAGADANGRQVQSGIYFAQLRLGDKVAATKVVVAN